VSEGKIYFTKAELIADWLTKYPKDANHPDLEQMATAGTFETKKGFVPATYYPIHLQQKGAE
jgi:hypothetical protein